MNIVACVDGEIDEEKGTNDYDNINLCRKDGVFNKQCWVNWIVILEKKQI